MFIKYLDTSLSGFNGGKNCDKSSPEAFLSSYMRRVKEVYEKRKNAYENHKLGYRKSWQTEFYGRIIKNYSEMEIEMLDFIKRNFFDRRETKL